MSIRPPRQLRKPSASFITAGESRQNASLAAAIAASRSSGVLAVSARGLTEVPESMFTLPAQGTSDFESHTSSSMPNWWEVVALTKADLSRNELAQLPDNLFAMAPTLTTLDVSSNSLRQLPRGLEQLQALRSLNLSNNPALEALPNAVALLPCLASLGCSDCGLKALPEGLGNQFPPMLAVLSAGSNLQLQELPLSLSRAAMLVKLDISGCSLSALPGELLRGWGRLQVLDASRNALTMLPPELGLLSSVTELRFVANKLQALPDEIAGCTALLELHVGFNPLLMLPESLSCVRGLLLLDARNCALECLPTALCSLELRLLDLSNNSLRSLPGELGSMTSLRACPLSGNPLKLIRPELLSGPISALLEYLRSRLPVDAVPALPGTTGVGSMYTDSHQHTLANCPGSNEASTELVLRGRGLCGQLPAEALHAGTLLLKLDASDNPRLTSIPASTLAACTALRSLILPRCGLVQWPLLALPGCLAHLTELQLSRNPLAAGSVPAQGAFAACPALRMLDVSEVPSAAVLLESLPDVPNLRGLVATAARLGPHMPALLARGTVPELRVLRLGGNKIASLPAHLAAAMPRLEELDLTGNELSSLPPTLGLMTSLSRLAVEGNPLRTVRRAIIEQGTAATLEYLRTRIPS